MIRKYSKFAILLILLSSMFLLSACSDILPVNINKEFDKYEKLAKEKNKEINLKPIVLTTYSDEIDLTLAQPKYKKFAANGKVTIEGKIKKHSKLKSDYAWIKVYSNEGSPAGNELEYYTEIKEGKFKQVIHFFNGEGEYQIKVQIPSNEEEGFFYDITTFEVINVNPKIQRDVTLTPFGFEADLSLDLKSSYLKEEGIFSLKGKAGNLSKNDTLMLNLKKDTKNWQHVIPIENGRFEYDVPLFYGEGLHVLEILVPVKGRSGYYQTATTVLIDNKANREFVPIEFGETYLDRGISLEFPKFGGDEAETTYKVKGSIDPKAEFAAETTHIYITSKKGNDEALDVIPVKDYRFDGAFYLRFGPGTYEVTVSVPEITNENNSYFKYFGFAQFEVESTGALDLRDVLPSRGVQSDAPKIKDLAKKIAEGKPSDRDKAKAIYEYVAKNIAYDVNKSRNYDFEWDDSALKALELKKGVCQDYSFLTIALLRASDIEARFIEGYAKERHAWVEAKLGGIWVTMDPTWGAGYVADNRFVREYNEAYFDPNMNEFNKTHSRIGVVY